MIKISVTNRNTKAKKEYEFKQDNILFGRAVECDVILDSGAVSRQHSQIHITKNLVEIEDLKSGNGTFVNQRPIPPRERVPLQKKDIIRIEEFDIEFDLIEPIEPEKKSSQPAKFDLTDPDILEVKMIKKILGAFDTDKTPTLIVTSTPFQDLKASIDQENQKFTIGREAGNDLRIDHQTVSRKHAVISQKWNHYVIRDLKSKNGTYVNGEKIFEEKTLSDGDEIVFGTIKTFFKNPQEFDIDAISKSLEEQNPAQDKLNKAANLTQKEEEKKTTVQASAQKKEDHSKEDKTNQNESSPKTKETQDVKSDEKKQKQDKKKETAKEKSQNQNKKSEKKEASEKSKSNQKKTDTKKQKASTMSQFSTSERALLGFGVLLVVVIIGMLLFLIV